MQNHILDGVDSDRKNHHEKHETLYLSVSINLRKTNKQFEH